MFTWWLKKSKLGITKLTTSSLLLGGLIFTLFFWNLSALTKGLSPAELSARSASSSVHTILYNPVYAPHKVLQYATSHIFTPSALALRSVSAVMAVIFLVCFFELVKSWFGKLIGFIAVLLLAATPWFVLLARSGGPEILLMAPVAVLASYYWLVRSKSRSAWLALIFSVCLVIYLPGGIWLILFGTLLARDHLKQSIGNISFWEKIIGVLALSIILAPLVYGSLRNSSALKPLLLIPHDWPSIAVAVKSIGWDVLSLFWRTPQHADFTIGRLPMLDGAQIALALFGGFALLKLARAKLYLLLGIVLFGVIAAGINRNLALLTFVLPAIALTVAGGLRYLYIQWRGVFPKNPLPKYFALTLIALLASVHIFYGLRYSLIAWPNSAATRSTYVLK